jgi:LEA14-like dessication related protein
VPHQVRVENIEESLELYMRVDNVYKDVKMIVKADGIEIKKVKKNHLTPGEMESIKLSLKDLIERRIKEITVELQREGA